MASIKQQKTHLFTTNYCHAYDLFLNLRHKDLQLSTILKTTSAKCWHYYKKLPLTSLMHNTLLSL